MNWAELGTSLVVWTYSICLLMVCLYGCHRYVLVFLYYRHRRNNIEPMGQFDPLPPVTIQLPMFNEKYVAERVIERTCQMEYPPDKLQIQVLDDSTDETVQIASAACERARQAGFDVEYIHREDRTGFKAGALQNGMKTAKGEYMMIFDADFLPDPQALIQSIHYFSDPEVCAVQTRWEHINRNDSMLTKTQAIFLDGHFVIEHVARNRSGRFMCFNGTAGTWRRAAIDDAGGWEHDTLTEDMDLSYRAQLRGWKFVFLPELTAPAELPPEMSAFKAQQFRWTKGGAQNAVKLLPKILLSKAPLKSKVEAFFHLTCFSVHAYALLLVCLLLPSMLLRDYSESSAVRATIDLTVFVLGTLSASVFYVASQYELFRDYRTVIKYLPFLMALGIGISLSNTKALLEGLVGKQSEFVRTPKFGDGSRVYDQVKQAGQGKKTRRRILPYFEFAMGVYMIACVVVSTFRPKTLLAAPFLLLFAFGFFYVSILTFVGYRAKAAAPQPQKQQA